MSQWRPPQMRASRAPSSRTAPSTPTVSSVGPHALHPVRRATNPVTVHAAPADGFGTVCETHALFFWSPIK